MFVVKIVVKCIIEENGKVLFLREGTGASWRPGTWALPGGKMEALETYDEAIDREVREETGLKVRATGLFEIEEIIARIGNEERLVHHYVFVCKKVGGKLIEPDGKQVAEYKWMTPSEIETLSQQETAEFYTRSLFRSYFRNRKKVIDPDFIKIWNELKSERIKKWLHDYDHKKKKV